MKTYEIEISELKTWFKNVTIESIEAMEKDKTPGKDGELVYARRKDVLEYNRRLMELKIKYGREKTAQTQISQSDFVYASVK